MPHIHNFLKYFVGLFAITFLGCSNNSEPEPAQNPTGIWSGSYDYYDPYSTVPGSPESYQITGLVWNGRWMLFYNGVYSQSEDRLWEGNPTVAGSSIEGAFQLYKNNNTDSYSYYYGSIHTKDYINGYLESSPAYNFMTGFSMNYLSLLTEAGSDISYLDGNWSDEEANGLITTLSVNLDGTVYGSDTNGCIYNGMVTSPDQNINIYKLDIELSICGSLDGIYSGLGYATTNRNIFKFVISNPENFIHLSLTRV